MSKYLGTLTLDLIAKVDGFSKNMDKARLKMEETTRSIERSAKSASDSVKGMLAVGGGYLSASTLAGFADAYTQISNRMKLVTNGSGEFNTAMDRTYDIAQKTRTAWMETAQVYQRFMQVSKEVGINQKKVGEITETVSKAIAISGTSAESAQAALMQFGQAMGAGVLRGDEFNSVAEQSPALLMAIAKGLGVNISALRKMAENGELTSKTVIKALENVKDSVDNDFSKISPTLSQAAETFKTSATKIIGEAGTTSGALSSLAEAIILVGNNLNTIATGAIIVGIGLLTKAIGMKTAAVYADIGASIKQSAADAAATRQKALSAAQENAALVSKLRNNIAAEASEVRLAGRILQSAAAEDVKTAAIGRSTAALIRQRAFEYELRAAQGESKKIHESINQTQSKGAAIVEALGGKLGLLSLAVSAVAGSYFYFKGKADEATKALYENSDAVNYNKKQWSALGELQKQQKVGEIKDKLADQNKALDDQARTITQVVRDMELYARSMQSQQAAADKYKDIVAKLRNGTISYKDAVEQVSKIGVYSTEDRKKLLSGVDDYNKLRLVALENVTALKSAGVASEIAGNKQENAAKQAEEYKNQLALQAKAANDARAANDELSVSLRKSTRQKAIETGLMTKYGMKAREAELTTKVYLDNVAKGYNGVSNAQRKAIRDSIKVDEEYQKALDAQKKTGDSYSKPSRIPKSTTTTPAVDKDDYKQYRQSISEQFATDLESIDFNLEDVKENIAKALFPKDELEKYTALAEQQYRMQNAAYFKNLNLELNQYKWTEERKLEYALEMDKEINENNVKRTKLEKDVYEKFLTEKYNYEIQQLDLVRRKRLLGVKQSYMSETAIMQERYKLEREEIEKNIAYTKEEREKLIAASKVSEATEKFNNYTNASKNWGGMEAGMMGYSEQYSLMQDKDSKMEASSDLFDASMALAETADEREEIWKAHNARMLLIEQDYKDKSLQLNMGYGQDILGSLTSIAKNVAGENSSLYAAMFAMEKGMAVARSIMAIQTALAQASANPFPMNLAAMATVAAQTASIVATIQGVQMPTGMAHSGIDNIPQEGTWLLDKGERVLSPRQNKDLTSYLDGKNSQLSSQATQQPNIRIVNSFDESELRGAMATPQGERIILNVIKRNRTALGI